MNLSGRRFFFAPLTFRDFLAVNDHVTGRFDADPHLCAIDSHDGHFDVIANS